VFHRAGIPQGGGGQKEKNYHFKAPMYKDDDGYQQIKQ
jgi:hypothetical protein